MVVHHSGCHHPYWVQPCLFWPAQKRKVTEVCSPSQLASIEGIQSFKPCIYSRFIRIMGPRKYPITGKYRDRQKLQQANEETVCNKNTTLRQSWNRHWRHHIELYNLALPCIPFPRMLLRGIGWVQPQQCLKLFVLELSCMSTYTLLAAFSLSFWHAEQSFPKKRCTCDLWPYTTPTSRGVVIQLANILPILSRTSSSQAMQYC